MSGPAPTTSNEGEPKAKVARTEHGEMAGSDETSKQLDYLHESLQSITVDMRLFTLCMRALNSNQPEAVGSETDMARQVTKLRDDTREAAMVYVKGILPISTSLVRLIRDFFEYYETLDIDTWRDCLPDILEDVKGFKQCCEVVVKLHEVVIISLNQRRDEAKVFMKELTHLSAEYQKMQQELEEAASTKHNWALVLMFFPVVAAIASPILDWYAEIDLANAIAKGAQREISQAAARTITEAMIPALEAFCKGLNAAAGFFSVLENELTSFQTRSDKAMETATHLHYTMMKARAESIGDDCHRFYAMIPGVRSDLLCIPNTGTDDNYVDAWLKEKQAEIREKYAGELTRALKKMLLKFTRRSAGDLMKYAEASTD